MEDSIFQLLFHYPYIIPITSMVYPKTVFDFCAKAWDLGYLVWEGLFCECLLVHLMFEFALYTFKRLGLLKAKP